MKIHPFHPYPPIPSKAMSGVGGNPVEGSTHSLLRGLGNEWVDGWTGWVRATGQPESLLSTHWKLMEWVVEWRPMPVTNLDWLRYVKSRIRYSAEVNGGD